uniref:Uncharacterized protein n=1 Tax=Anguilla anguilla TaxID=7936 RepID=A0A0E9UK38_ANGAN
MHCKISTRYSFNMISRSQIS